MHTLINLSNQFVGPLPNHLRIESAWHLCDNYFCSLVFTASFAMDDPAYVFSWDPVLLTLLSHSYWSTTCLSPRLSYPILPVLLLPDSNQQAMPLAVVYKYPDILTSNHFSLYPHLKSKYMKMVKASEVIMDRALISYPNIILKVLWEFIIFFQNSNSLNSV